MSGILDGIRIVDATVGLAGPFATRLLAEAGAGVITLEPAGGDPLRRTAPAAFASWNRGKLSATIPLDDMLHIDGLLNKSDVFVHGWTQPEARQRGFDDASIGARHPHLIAASVTSFPTNHPDSDVPNHEILVQARLGAMDEQLGYRSGPVFIRLPFANWGASFLLAGGIVARLYQRVRQGRSGPIHTSLVQGALVAASMVLAAGRASA